MEVKIYQTKEGKQPFIKWYDDLKDQFYQLRIRKKLRQITLGNFGDSKSVGDGVYELRFFFGKGYRVYYAKESNVIVLLLCGGDKSTQQKDINQAKVYWQDYQERNK
jgi:putative addiction module killer protein